MNLLFCVMHTLPACSSLFVWCDLLTHSVSVQSFDVWACSSSSWLASTKAEGYMARPPTPPNGIQGSFNCKDNHLVNKGFWFIGGHTPSRTQPKWIRTRDRPIIGRADYRRRYSAFWRISASAFFFLIRRPIRDQYKTGLFWLWCSRASLSAVTTLSPALSNPQHYLIGYMLWLHAEPRRVTANQQWKLCMHSAHTHGGEEKRVRLVWFRGKLRQQTLPKL